MKHRDWYPRLNRWLRAMSEQNIYPFENVVCAFAALSPRITYRMNCQALTELIQHGHTTLGFGHNISKAKEILWSDTPLEDVTIKHPSKCDSFARAILGDTEAVTLDTWMLSHLGFDGWITPRRYERMAAKLSKKARRAGESPRDYQAKVWIEQRGSAA